MIRIFGQRINRWGRDYRRDSGRAEKPESWAWCKLSWKHQQFGGGFSKHLVALACFWLALSQRFGGLWGGVVHSNGGL